MNNLSKKPLYSILFVDNGLHWDLKNIRIIMDYTDIKNIWIIIHFQWILIDYFVIL